ncbi:hypothetical protein HFO39_23485 [Rhizobium leguminosarum]|uniref:hypothetical protein n=1 Tax=Rhizobium leguminosarum TaxID=384 RepID=UPI001C948411|nr:hypothetical protein [Rhizobium leguminosarum]MBY5637695.1 hypothetical protein [Rhizobium leguminosarum]
MFFPNPTPAQYSIFRIVLALAGSGLSALIVGELGVQISGINGVRLQATAGIAVLVLLFFFSPASLVVNEPLVAASKLVSLLEDPKSPQNAAIRFLDDRMKKKDIQTPLQLARQPTEEALTQLDKSIHAALDEPTTATHYRTVLDFYKSVVGCAQNSTCDTPTICEKFFENIDAFRTFYCGEISDSDHQEETKMADSFEKFAVDNCRINFVSKYIDFPARSFTRLCIPTQCWATNRAPPYPCQR